MNEKLRQQNDLYWIVGLLDDARIHVHAASTHTLNGDLTFFDTEGVMLTAFAKGTWTFCTPASVIDGSLILIEHWNRGASRDE